MSTLGPSFNPGETSTWFANGIGSNALVYTGQLPGEAATRTIPSGKGIGKVSIATTGAPKDNIQAVTTLTASIWTDVALQNKIIGAYAAKGKPISKLEAGAIWGELVTKAGQIYAGGRGPKITPLDLLADQMSVMKGDEAALPQRSIQKIDPIVIKDFVSGIYEKTLGRVATDDEKNQWYSQLKPAIEGGTVTETKKIKNKKTGKLENVSTTTPGFNQQATQISIEQKLKEANPDDYDRQKRMDFSTWLSQNLLLDTVYPKLYLLCTQNLIMFINCLNLVKRLKQLKSYSKLHSIRTQIVLSKHARRCVLSRNQPIKMKLVSIS